MGVRNVRQRGLINVDFANFRSLLHGPAHIHPSLHTQYQTNNNDKQIMNRIEGKVIDRAALSRKIDNLGSFSI